MFGIGFSEFVLILIIGLIVIGPEKLPDLARSLAKGLAEFKRASSEIRDSLETHLDSDAPPVTNPKPPSEPDKTTAPSSDSSAAKMPDGTAGDSSHG